MNGLRNSVPPEVAALHALTDQVVRVADALEQPSRQGQTLRPLLATLIARWEEVADSYKPEPGDTDDVTRRYRDRQRIYLRVIDDLTTALVQGRLPYALMTDAEAAEHGIVRDGAR